ncbi:MAG: four helix bundle protein [Planctomycetaceae bacterium]
MRNHKNLTFWDDLVKALVRSYRFGTSLPANDQYALGADVKRVAVRVRTKVVAGAATESEVACARELDGAYQGLKEITSSIEFAVELGITKPELVADLLATLDRLAGAVFAYRRTLSES